MLIPSGEFDISSVHLLRDGIIEALERTSTIVLDMSDVTFVDSTALGAIVGGHRLAAGRRGGWMRIAAPQANIDRILRLMAMDQLLGIYDTVEQALTS